jgi:hypothetical protein
MKLKLTHKTTYMASAALSSTCPSYASLSLRGRSPLQLHHGAHYLGPSTTLAPPWSSPRTSMSSLRSHLPTFTGYSSPMASSGLLSGSPLCGSSLRREVATGHHLLDGTYWRLVLHDLMDKRLPDSTNVSGGTGS